MVQSGGVLGAEAVKNYEESGEKYSIAIDKEAVNQAFGVQISRPASPMRLTKSRIFVFSEWPYVSFTEKDSSLRLMVWFQALPPGLLQLHTLGPSNQLIH